MPDFSTQANALHRRGIRTSAQLCEALLNEAGVACLPGTDFGRPATEFTLRLAFVDFDGADALAAVARGETVNAAFVRRHCASVLAAIEQLEAWMRQPAAVSGT